MNRHGLLLSLSLCITTFAAFGCDEAAPRGGVSSSEGTADDDDSGRGDAGKADAVLEGLCGALDGEEAACGGPAPVGNCWCDAACEQYGDCCVDAFDACGVGEPQPAVSQCLADAHCDEGQQCSGGVCIDVQPAPASCNDGSSLSPFCDIKPGCPDGQVAAIVGGCFACVDATTCEPAPQPGDCDDGSSLHPLCDIKPACADGEVAAVINSCFSCVDAVSCE